MLQVSLAAALTLVAISINITTAGKS